MLTVQAKYRKIILEVKVFFYIIFSEVTCDHFSIVNYLTLIFSFMAKLLILHCEISDRLAELLQYYGLLIFCDRMLNSIKKKLGKIIEFGYSLTYCTLCMYMYNRPFISI